MFGKILKSWNKKLEDERFTKYERGVEANLNHQKIVGEARNKELQEAAEITDKSKHRNMTEEEKTKDIALRKEQVDKLNKKNILTKNK